jgi:pyruvate dehydrogenase E2 component (dihydrolipoamide acetyltransferase)
VLQATDLTVEVAARAVVKDGSFVAVPTMTMTLTCDHRAIDGAVGADFLRTLKQLVESPALAL